MQDGKHFIITGVSSGIGLALTRALLESGHRVQGCGRRSDPLPEAEREKYGTAYSYKQIDIMEFDAVKEWAEVVHRQGVRIDYLIHNAAVIHDNARLWEIDRNQLQSVLEINVMGTFNVLQAFLPGMLRASRGIIITLSSGAGRIGIPQISGYCASKWAVEGLTKSLAEELPPGMSAFPMSPGMVDTDMLRTNFGDEAGYQQKPEDWAKAAVPYILNLNPANSGESITSPDSRS